MKPRTARPRPGPGPERILAPLLLAAWSLAIPGAAAGAEPADRQAGPAAPHAGGRAILGVDQVRRGMTGYGLTVFEGSRIEPFAVEVVSIDRNFGPKRSVIWIRCPEARMQLSGPVQGMSGSPIYLWDDDDRKPREPGKGGRLIGAFAFGFGASKDCYVGVQPIEQMLDVASRARPGAPGDAQPRASLGVGASETLRRLLAAAREQDLPTRSTWRGRAVCALLGSAAQPEVEPEPAPGGPRNPRNFPVGAGPVRRLMLPIPIPDADLANLASGLLEPLGLGALPVAAGALAGKPPPDVDVQNLRLQPGGVLAVPLAFGDLDLSAAGTITDVLPDGRVLGFGHQMFGQGTLAVPMATGFVHMVLPHLITSFKLGGSATIQGALVRDENAAVIGRPDGTYAVAPANVTVTMAGHEPHEYSYQLVQHRQIGPVVAALVAASSLTAHQSPPLENTLSMTGTLAFTGGRTLTLDSMFPAGSMREVFFEIAAICITMIQNPFEPIELESMSLATTVEPVIRSGSIIDGRLLQPRIAPGQTLSIAVRIQPYGEPILTKVVQVPVPQSLPDGEYNLIVSDASKYLQLMRQSRPHLDRVVNADELAQNVQRVLSVPSNALFVLLQLPDEGLAIGRDELPMLPSSRRAMIAVPTSTQATTYTQWARTIEPLDVAVEGHLAFTVTVRSRLTDP